MDFAKLMRKRALYEQMKNSLPVSAVKSYEAAFDVEYTHNSTAIEGNTLTLIETKVVLEDRLSIGGKALREIYEVISHSKAFGYAKQCIAEGKPLSETIVKELHAILMENIFVGGIYRNEPVYITGAGHTPPVGMEMYHRVKSFYENLALKQSELNSIEMAAWTHAEFVRIHPFVDGNGRVSRLIMNYQLMTAGFPPISIAKENRLAYYDTLDAYASEGDLEPFVNMIAELADGQLDRYLSMTQQQQINLPEQTMEFK